MAVTILQRMDNLTSRRVPMHSLFQINGFFIYGFAKFLMNPGNWTPQSPRRLLTAFVIHFSYVILSKSERNTLIAMNLSNIGYQVSAPMSFKTRQANGRIPFKSMLISRFLRGSLSLFSFMEEVEVLSFARRHP
ncbi:hypothetical protein CEXT_128571 [Caerostris extrusa]|uniref:Uncharacterized protein n=1 Tax=Caerostris extrusa TaxID=172846 RepID=A0AAV4RR21_CAEEX|nr:hypothetical protein CEXT_128571 [Caerostris extrusa]